MYCIVVATPTREWTAPSPAPPCPLRFHGLLGFIYTWADNEVTSGRHRGGFVFRTLNRTLFWSLIGPKGDRGAIVVKLCQSVFFLTLLNQQKWNLTKYHE